MMLDFAQKKFEEMIEVAKAASMKEPDVLSDAERVALALAAGCEVSSRLHPDDPNKVIFYTINPVAFVRLRPGEPLRVYEQKRPFGSLL